MDYRRVEVVIPDAKLLPHIDSVNLFPESLVFIIIKIKAPYQVLPIHCMRIGYGDHAHPRTYGKQVRIRNLMLPLMPVMLFFLYFHRQVSPLFTPTNYILL